MPSHGTQQIDRQSLRHSLIVSCQPVPDGPTDTPDFVVGFARAAVAAGAAAVRIESVRYVAAVRKAVTVPVIGIVKRDLDDSSVRITPYRHDVTALAGAGADIIAFDATDRVRPEPVAALIEAIRQEGKLAMADCSSIEDAKAALALGVDFVGTTLSGYVGGPVPDVPDIALIAALRALTPHVIAEGRLKVPADAAAAAEAGAFAVVVGSAITRTEHATDWFLRAVRDGFRAQEAAERQTLAVDLGGTKTLAALVRGGTVVSSITVPTERAAGPAAWLEAVRRAADIWQPLETQTVGLAVTGVVRNGLWSALNRETLPVPDGFPLIGTAKRLFPECRIVAANDAQAAAWGEYRHGAGRGAESLVYLTISTGVGGGIILEGKLRSGLAGHFGQTGHAFAASPFENAVSGRWIAGKAAEAGHPVDAKAVFAAASAGEPWASGIIAESTRRVAGLCRDIKLALDVDRIVIGGGIGLAEGFFAAVRGFADEAPPHLRPDIYPATLGGDAGVIGAAALANRV
ncbi:MAG: putative N-acetylmannosamine-6-phosphate 2-epimerase [Shinella sp.]|nr:putative N-acetylmannosamine-6-phosphate 2-epimerase [Shinella sp.]